MKVKIFLKEHPFVRLSLPLLAGTLIANNTNWTSFEKYLLFSILFLLIFSVFLKYNYKSRFFYGIIAYTLIFLISQWSWTLKKFPNLAYSNKKNQLFYIKIEQQKSNSNIFFAKAYQEDEKNFYFNLILKSPKTLIIKKGDVLYGKFEFKKLNRSPYYNTFSEDNYYKYSKSIEVSLDIIHSNFKHYRPKKSEPNFIESLCENLYQLASKDIENKEFNGFMKGLCFGNSDDLAIDIKKMFGNNGVMHILSVSGMHVGIIYLFFMGLFDKLIRKKKLFWIKSLIIILILIVYSFICGLSPSILRASTVLILIVIGRTINRKTIALNLLSIAFFFQIVLNPYNLFQIGFQLSYLAVISLIVFFPLVNQHFQPKYKFLKYPAALILSSLIVQIGTLSICLYNFHQFPSYFLLANLIIVPICSILLISGFLKIFLFGIPILNEVINYFMEFLFKWMMYLLNWINTLPMNVYENVYIDKFSIFLLTLILIFIIPFFLMNNYKKIITILILISLILVKSLNDKYINISKPYIEIFSHQKFPIIIIKNKATIHMVSSDSNIRYALNHLHLINLYKKDLSKIKTCIIPTSTKHFQMKNRFINLQYYSTLPSNLNKSDMWLIFDRYSSSHVNAISNSNTLIHLGYGRQKEEGFKNIHSILNKGPFKKYI